MQSGQRGLLLGELKVLDEIIQVINRYILTKKTKIINNEKRYLFSTPKKACHAALVAASGV